MGITTDAIANKSDCNGLSVGLFNGDLTECPTKTEINQNKKLIVLEKGIVSNKSYSDSYTVNQLVKYDDLGYYTECIFETHDDGQLSDFCPEIRFHNKYVNEDSAEPNDYIWELVPFNTGQLNTYTGSVDLGLSKDFFSSLNTSNVEITANNGSGTYDLQKFKLNGLSGIKSYSGEYFVWHHTNAYEIINDIKTNRKLNIFMSNIKDPVITYGLSISYPGSTTLDKNGTKTLTAKLITYTDGVKTGSIDVTAAWKTSNASNISISSSSGSTTTITAKKSGVAATITATYTFNGQTLTDTVTFNVNSIIKYEIVLTPQENYTLTPYVGKYVYFDLTLYTITDGSYNGGTNLNYNDNVTWEIGNNSVIEQFLADYPYTYKAIAPGTSTVSASYVYNGETLTATSTINVQRSFITANISEYTFGKEGGSVDIIVTCSPNITYISVGKVDASGNTVTASWLTNFKTNNDDGSYTYTLTASENTTSSSREVYFKLHSSSHDKPVQLIKITQNAGDAYVNVNTSQFNIAANKLSVGTVTVTSSGTWTAESDSDWLIISKSSGSSGNIVSITSTANTDVTPRTGIITFTCGTANTTVKVVQEGIPASIIMHPTAWNNISAAGDYKYVSITSTSAWSIESKPDWVTVSKSSGSSGEIKITVIANLSLNERTGIIKFVCTGASYEFTVSQNANELIPDSVSAEPDTFTINSDTTYVGNTTILSSGTWTAVSNDTWLTISKNSGSSNETLTITASVNTSTAERTGTITVKSGLATDTITVTQRGAVVVGRGKMLFTASNFAGTNFMHRGYSLTQYTGDYYIGPFESWATSNCSNSGYTYSYTDIGSSGYSFTVSKSSAWTSGYYYMLEAENNVTYMVEAYISPAAANSLNSGTDYTVDVNEYELAYGASSTDSISINPSSWYVSAAGEYAEFKITSSQNWTLTSKPSWITSVASQGVNGATLRLGASQNTSATSRSGYVKFSCGSATAQIYVYQYGKTEPKLKVNIGNLSTLIQSRWGSDGLDEYIYLVDSSGTLITGLECDLYSFEGDTYNTISGTYSEWMELSDYYYNDVYLSDYESTNTIFTDTLGDSQWDEIYDALREMRADETNQTITINWPAKQTTTTTYELVITPDPIELYKGGTPVSATATFWTLVNGVRTTSTNVTSSCTWTTSNSRIASGANGSSTISAGGIYPGTTLGTATISANYTYNDTKYIDSVSAHLYDKETISIPITFSAENWGDLGQECDINISVQLYNSKTRETKAICSNKHIVVGDVGNGTDSYYATLKTVTIYADEKADWSIQMWGYKNACTSGTFKICLVSDISGARYYDIQQDMDTGTEWDTTSASPYGGSLANLYKGASIDIYFRGD